MIYNKETLTEYSKKHTHTVDIYIKSQNRMIEVKSTWTLKKRRQCIFKTKRSNKTRI